MSEKKIEKLTDEQYAAMQPHAEMWIKRALECRPAKRDVMERGIRGYYRISELAEPKMIFWGESCFAVVIAGPIAAYLLEKRITTAPDLTSVVSQICAVPTFVASVQRIVDQICAAGAAGQLTLGVLGEAAAQLQLPDESGTGPVVDLGGLSVPEKSAALPDGSMTEELADELLKIVRSEWFAYQGGAAWAAWPAAWATFYRDVVGVDIELEAVQAAEDATEGWWWWPHVEFAVVSDRPVELHRDERDLLHYPDGPAIRFADGWEIYAWHGLRIPGEWIKNKATIDPSLALTWPQIEQRRALAEILGWDKVLAKLSPKIIDTDADPEIGTLLEVDLPDAPASRFLRVVCGTGRVFAISVPSEMQTALEANAWTWQLPAQMYKPEVRT